MKHFLYFLLLSAAVCYFSCNRTVYTMTDKASEYLAFATGGGFTGAIISYHLMPNGQLFKVNNLSRDTTELPKVKKSLTSQLMERAAAIDWSVDVNRPGNVYHIIRLRTEAGDLSATWGDTGYEPPTEMTELYSALQELVPDKEDTE